MNVYYDEIQYSCKIAYKRTIRECHTLSYQCIHCQFTESVHSTIELDTVGLRTVFYADHSFSEPTKRDTE